MNREYPETIDTNASSNPYDNTTSGLAATNVQAAVDELATNAAADTDQVVGNEFNTNVSVNAGAVEVTDGGGTLSADLISTDLNNDIVAGTDGALYLNVASVTISETITNLTDNGNGTLTYVNESGASQTVNKSDITDNADGTYTFTNNDGSDVILDTRAASNFYDDTTSGLGVANVQDAIRCPGPWKYRRPGSNLSGNPYSGTDLQIDIENGGSANVDLSSLVGTDDQALSLSGNTLTLEDGGTVDLTPYLDNTDDQQITDFSLTGNIVTLTLEDGGTQTIDLTGFVSTDDQALSLSGTTLTLEDGGNVDLSGFVSTDDQALSLSGNTLTLEDGGTVDLTPYLDNTDDQQITDFSLTGNIVTLTLEDGGTQTIDLTGLFPLTIRT